MDVGGYADDYKDMDDFTKNSFWRGKKYKFPIQFGLLCFILLPLCLLKNIGKMRFTSFIGVGSLLVMYIIVFVEAPWYMIDYWTNIYKKDDKSTHLNFFNVEIGFQSDLAFLKGMATLFYGFGTHYGAYPIMCVVKNRTYERLQKIFIRGILVCAILYMSMGVIGYLSVPYDTPVLIIERYKLFESDIFMTIGRTVFILTLLFKIPANYNSMRISVLVLIFGKSDVSNFRYNSLVKYRNYIVTIPILIIACLISVLYKEIISYITLMGSFCVVVVSFLCPCLIYLKSNDYPRYHWKNVTTFILMIFLCLIGLMAGVMSIIDIINGEEE